MYKNLTSLFAILAAIVMGAVAYTSAGVAQTPAAAKEIYVICKKPNRMSAHAGCINAFDGDNEVCSGDGKTCAPSVFMLCREVGKVTGHGFKEFASGQGSFSDANSCEASCEKEYGAAWTRFGGKCLKTVMDRSAK